MTGRGTFVAGYVLPHFGALDAAMLNVPYARNSDNSDQRPLRSILGRV